jgi:phosphoglycerate dehydrogenase-like enzyme
MSKGKRESDSFVSRRQLIGQAAVATAALGVAALPQSAHAVGHATPTPKDNRPRLPLNLLGRNNLSEDLTAQIKAISPQINILPSDRFAEQLPNADVVIGKVLPEEFASAKKLRWIQMTSGGVDAVLTPELAASDVILTNVSGSYAGPIAEQAIAFMMSLARGVNYQAYNRKWNDSSYQLVELRGETMGIIGLGSIGRSVANKGKALGMRVIAVDAEPMHRERYTMVDEVWLVDTHLDELLKQTMFLMICAPLTRRTNGMIGARQFALMPNGSFIVNVTRGKIINTTAMMEALQSGKLRGAGLDVTDPEPLPDDHPLWKVPNVVITPHKAGGSKINREPEIFVENMRRFTAGLPLMNVVDKQKEY